jgi:hypothetical protein
MLQGLCDFPVNIDQALIDIARLQSAAGTAFLNFAKRYGAQIDLTAKEKGAKDNKRGRRWARKDLVSDSLDSVLFVAHCRFQTETEETLQGSCNNGRSYTSKCAVSRAAACDDTHKLK